MPGNQTVKVRLDSWKDIANYLGRDVRTVIRWEKKGLPVHRVPGGQRQAVFAYTEEIDAWLVSQDGEGSASNGANEPTEKSEENLQVRLGDDPPLQPVRSGSLARLVPVNKWIVFAAVLCLVGPATLLLLHSRSSATIRPLRFVQLTDDGRQKLFLRSGPTTLYFTEFEVNREILMSVPIGGGPIRQVDLPFSNVNLQDISADGQTLLVTSFEGTEPERQLWIVPAQGGTGRRVGDAVCHSARWSPDNRTIACASGTSILLFDSDGSNSRTLGPFHSPAEQLQWSPNGERLRFVLEDSVARSRSPWEITIGKDKGTVPDAPSKLPLGDTCCFDWIWTKTGKNFVYLRNGADGRPSLFLRSQNGWLAGGLTHESELPVKVGVVEALAPGKDDNTLYLLTGGSGRGALLKFDVKQKLDSKHKAFQTFLDGLSASYLSFSRDGQWMTYTNTQDNSLWRSRPDGSDALQLTTAPMAVEFSAWSPDGRQIAFMGKQPEKPWRIFLISRDGGVPTEAAPGNDNQGAPTWSPDGKALVYGNVVCQEMEACWIRSLDLATGRVEALPGSHGFRTARWSPDGKYIVALQSQTQELMLFNTKNRRWIAIANSITGDNINWSNDSQSVYVDSARGQKPVIEQVRIADHQRSTVVDLASLQNVPGQIGTWIGLTPDNSPILFHTFTASEVYALEWTDN